MPGHFDGSPGAGGLEETPGGAFAQHGPTRCGRTRGQAGVNTMDPGAGLPAVGTGRNGSEGLRGMRRNLQIQT